ncbi:MAG TPA: helix-turn-helix transcriptional regulator [Thermoanaerobaculia bacterium]|nr:helix-turn-helix transcriptional regulator [Thermoanaerobaculia bacterium]
MFDLIGETLRRLRKEHRLTLEELGEAAELGRGQLSRIENSKQEATLSTLAKILSCQGVSRREFFRRYDLVESEALAVQRQGAGEGAPEAQGDWPEEIRQVLGKVESFVQLTFGQPRPVAQGAIEVGEWVVLFRVVPKEGTAAPAPKDLADTPRPRKSGRRGASTSRKAKR